jgi:hypothetical protein
VEQIDKLNNKYKNMSYVGTVSPSLQSFLKSEPISEWVAGSMISGALCEIGCGTRSLFEHWDDILPGRMTRELIACDLSSEAIDKAKCNQENKVIDYFVQDITKPFKKNDFECFIDGHCLHSLNSLPDLFQAMGNIYNALNFGGIVVGEVMMAHKNMTFENGLEYFENECVLYKNESPSRVFMTSHEWEDFFLACGFTIKYFMCQSSIKFIPHDDRSEALSGDPECLRYVLEKSKEKSVV